ncbi:unnamed protein product [Clonostachys byssicola]|uniref:N-acetyltransferase domain-containing protein n=1 Tax=Clonostachys byssicola TaxID=160290 RepID=A0A9N9TYY2_9HYPO|nr:unnamed protein product [Clonostachys byssicola]
MASVKSNLQARSWEKGQFLISTDPKLFPIKQLIQVFESSDFYWAKSLSPRVMQETLDNSLSFGLYKRPQPTSPAEPTESTPGWEFLGIARCVTDFVTFVYLTDVWVEPTQQGKGLGTWIVQCVQEVLVEMPDLRRSMLFTADWKRSVPFYQKLMGMELIESKRGEGLAVMESKGRSHPNYGREGTGY